MSNEALQLACRFSLPPNSLGYCGRDTAPKKFMKCVINGKCAGVEKELSEFIVLNPYLKTLSKITKKPKFSYEVIEAYWIGNNELKKARVTDYQILLDNFIKQGVPGWFVKELRIKVPKVFIPHHLFQILHAGVGKASRSVPYNLETINNCMVRWGEVKKIGSDYLIANLFSLAKKSGSYKLVKNKSRAMFSSDFLPNLKLGNIVAVHWNQAVKVLSPEEVKRLSFWTNEVLCNNSEA